MDNGNYQYYILILFKNAVQQLNIQGYLCLKYRHNNLITIVTDTWMLSLHFQNNCLVEQLLYFNSNFLDMYFLEFNQQPSDIGSGNLN